MNTRVFLDIDRYRHRAFAGATKRQAIYVIPTLILSIIVLCLNAFVWNLGEWFSYAFLVLFAMPPLMMGLFRPYGLDFEVYLRYRLHYELTQPIRLFLYQKEEEDARRIKTKRISEWESYED